MAFLIPKDENKEREKKPRYTYMSLAITPKRNVLGPVPGTLIKII